MSANIELLQASPFFESISAEHLKCLADHGRLETVHKGSVLLRSGQRAEKLYMLVAGKIQLFYELPNASLTCPGQVTKRVSLRTIGESGRVIGWSAMVEPYHYRASVEVLEEAQLLAFDRDWLHRYAEAHPDFGIELMRRVLWVLGNRLRASRVRLVASRYDQEVLAIRTLLDQSKEQLSVRSPLHKLPFYLENRLTLSDAFCTLNLLRAHGESIERNLASLCLDILQNAQKELAIYQCLQAVYEDVANAPSTASAEEVRRRCCEDFIRLFGHTRYQVRGQELLPEQPGHIFIMNHLQNHPVNTLPNNFQLTLDTHFVSSVILYKKYGQAPIRVIRKSQPDEYGHQQYYDRLGYIYVYHGHMDEDMQNPAQYREQRRRLFLETAGNCLRQGRNVVICPEGASASTQRSPLPLKAGAFRLASVVRPEPLLVPIAVANFDKRIARTPLAAVIQKPFRLSDVLPDPVSDEALFAFVNAYQQRLRQFVSEAIQCAQTMT